MRQNTIQTYIFNPQLHHPRVILVRIVILKHGQTLLQRLAELVLGVDVNILFQPANVSPPQIQGVIAPVAVYGIFPVSLVVVELLQGLSQIELVLLVHHFVQFQACSPIRRCIKTARKCNILVLRQRSDGKRSSFPNPHQNLEPHISSPT